MTPRTRTSSWRTALSLFTVIPVARSASLNREAARRAVVWLPVLGALLAVLAAGVMAAVELGGDAAPRRLLAAALAIAVLGLLTGGLHLDGLADTIDGLGSRRRGQEALDIMRRSDVGPLGVAALVLVLLLQVTSLAVVAPGAPASVALVAAVTTSRGAVVLTAGAPAARPDGFGALITGATTARVTLLVVAVLLAAITTGGAVAGGLDLAIRCLAAAVVGLGVAGLLSWVARRRLGGMTGDVFGAVIEVTTATVLLVVAISW